MSSTDVKGMQDYQSMDESHNWIFQKSDTYGKLGLLVMCFCDKCGAERVVLTVKYAENLIP